MSRYKLVAVILINILISKFSFAQPTWTFDPFGKEKKPEKFENRKLGSERTTEKKFTKVRHFIQNSVTHYNYYFNANNKLNAVIERAKMSQQDDFTKLLPFYPYNLDNTANEKAELDSIIYKSTAGILLHDLRNDWIDNLYMLIGKSYYLKKDFDSAAMTFQFINYNLFPRKKKEDEDRIVGTNTESVNSFISIANKEERNFLQKMVSLPPSRNDALIWMARTLTEQQEYGEAAGMINILNNDASLPERLQDDLSEINAYWFFKQRIYDSAATYLEKALTNAETKNDQARWEFLLAQLLEINKNYDKASEFYAKAAKHTVDPLMNIYAQLNDAKMLKDLDDTKSLDNNINNLARMGRKDKFDGYRDIIYYAAGELSMYKPDTTAAIGYFLKSVKNSQSNTLYKNKSFLQLADIAFVRKDYKNAQAYYDSLQTGDEFFANRIDEIQNRKNTLTKIIEKINNIERQDSLLHIAAMPAAEREDLIKALLKKLRKQQNSKGDSSESYSGNAPITFNNNNNQPANLFTNPSDDEWYFYNTSAKNNGFNEFKNKWGNRKNTDNWRRGEAAKNTVIKNTDDTTSVASNQVNNKTEKTEINLTKYNNNTELSYEGLMSNIPLTPGKVDTTNKVISINLFELGKLYQNQLEAYQQAIDAYEEHLERYPTELFDGELYMNLFYCYSKLGDMARANYYKNLLNNKFAGNKFATMANNPIVLNSKYKDPVVTKLYEGIYNLFIEGSFTEALSQKKKADSVHGTNYWTPQLLYIESVYYIKQRNDSTAIATLEKSIELFPQSIMVPKTQNLIDVLKRRAEIEDYLTKLNITRAEDDKILYPGDEVVKNNPPVDTVQKIVPPVDTVKKVVVVPVDTVEKVIPTIDTAKQTTITSPSDTAKKIVSLTDSIKKGNVISVDAVKIKKSVLTDGVFTMNPEAPHNVIMLLDKVDPVYITEARNAITRYNREAYKGQNIEIIKDALDGTRTILIFTNFKDGDAALDYYLKLQKAAPIEIGWLPVNKYSFLIITNENLQLLKNNKNVNGYRNLLNKQYADKF